MNFKRRIDWRKWLGVAGWVALGYFIGRPEQLSRMARNLENHLIGDQRYIVPARIRTTVAPVLVHRQPPIVASAPQAHSWSYFYDPNGHYSIMVPPHKLERVTDTDKTMNSIRLGDELYIFGYMDSEGFEFISYDGKQALIRESLNKGWNSNAASEQFSIVAQRHFGLNGNPGVEIQLQHRSKPIRMTFRQMIVGNRLYMTGVSNPSPQKEQTFLNSLRLH